VLEVADGAIVGVGVVVVGAVGVEGGDALLVGGSQIRENFWQTHTELPLVEMH
jgi:hypothetical protein